MSGAGLKGFFQSRKFFWFRLPILAKMQHLRDVRIKVFEAEPRKECEGRPQRGPRRTTDGDTGRKTSAAPIRAAA